MSVPRVKVRCTASVLAARMAMAAGAPALGLVSAMPSGSGPIDEAFFAALPREPA
jgi:phosphoribosylanthranilate isomerase